MSRECELKSRRFVEYVYVLRMCARRKMKLLKKTMTPLASLRHSPFVTMFARQTNEKQLKIGMWIYQSISHRLWLDWIQLQSYIENWFSNFLHVLASIFLSVNRPEDGKKCGRIKHCHWNENNGIIVVEVKSKKACEFKSTNDSIAFGDIFQVSFKKLNFSYYVCQKATTLKIIE